MRLGHVWQSGVDGEGPTSSSSVLSASAVSSSASWSSSSGHAKRGAELWGGSGACGVNCPRVSDTRCTTHIGSKRLPYKGPLSQLLLGQLGAPGQPGDMSAVALG